MSTEQNEKNESDSSKGPLAAGLGGGLLIGGLFGGPLGMLAGGLIGGIIGRGLDNVRKSNGEAEDDD